MRYNKSHYSSTPHRRLNLIVEGPSPCQKEKYFMLVSFSVCNPYFLQKHKYIHKSDQDFLREVCRLYTENSVSLSIFQPSRSSFFCYSMQHFPWCEVLITDNNYGSLIGLCFGPKVMKRKSMKIRWN